MKKVKAVLPSFEGENPAETEKIIRIMVTANFNLQGIASKQDVLRNTPLCTGWMVFINRACTLAHIMHCEDVENGEYIRKRIPHTLQGSHPEYLRRWFYHHMKSRYII